MKTTVELPDNLYRHIKAQAAARGQTVRAFFLDAVRAKLADEKAQPTEKSGWRAVFGLARPADVAAVQRIIDAEFSAIDSEIWE